MEATLWQMSCRQQPSQVAAPRRPLTSGDGNSLQLPSWTTTTTPFVQHYLPLFNMSSTRTTKRCCRDTAKFGNSIQLFAIIKMDRFPCRRLGWRTLRPGRIWRSCEALRHPNPHSPSMAVTGKALKHIGEQINHGNDWEENMLSKWIEGLDMKMAIKRLTF